METQARTNILRDDTTLPQYAVHVHSVEFQDFVPTPPCFVLK